MQQLEQSTSFVRKNWKIIIIIFLLCLITLSTKYYGSTDIGDYSDIAKYFAGYYSAKPRSSHSYLYGTLHAPFVALLGNFIVFKISSLIFLLLLVYSVYLATKKNKKALWLMLLSPIVWYMSPWINPIQLSSLLFFWGYLAIKKYEKTEKLKFLLFSGILVGLSWAFWDGMIFLSIIFAVSFLFNRKFYNFILFFIFTLIGLLPKLILDNFLFGFPFIGILRYLGGIVAADFFQGVYGTMSLSFSYVGILIILLFLPFFSYKLFSRENWHDNKKSLIFITLVFLIILKNLQPRHLLLLIPILIFELAPKLTKSQIKKQIIISIILISFVITPYLIQTKYSTNAEEFYSLLININKIEIFDNEEKLIEEDLKSIIKEFPGRIFIVGNQPDDYQYLAHLYWKEDVKEFVSIQDYQLFLENKTILFERTFMPSSNINNRRQIWISGGIGKNQNDDTDYNSIDLAIGVREPIKLENFSLVKKYNLLYLSKKTG